MSTSTDAILFYGYCFGDDFDNPPWKVKRNEDGDLEDGYDDEESIYASAVGVNPPKEEYPVKNDDSDVANEIRLNYSAYWADKSRVNKESCCEIIRHCSGDYPMYGVAVSSTVIKAWRGYPKDLKNCDHLIVDVIVNNLLKNYCEKMGIDVTGLEPSWWMVSYWG
jgi:hypothetical protein